MLCLGQDDIVVSEKTITELLSSFIIDDYNVDYSIFIITVRENRLLKTHITILKYLQNSWEICWCYTNKEVSLIDLSLS